LQTHGVAASHSADATITKLERDIPELMKKGNVPGLAIAVIRKRKTSWMRGFGVKETNTGVPVTEDKVFEAASLSKPVFAYGVLKLVEQGKLGLDVPLTTYSPKLYLQGDDRLSKITARIVLSQFIVTVAAFGDRDVRGGKAGRAHVFVQACP
jgi:CubicO group peptidase (beta-lactamase class C family)